MGQCNITIISVLHLIKDNTSDTTYHQIIVYKYLKLKSAAWEIWALIAF